MKSVHRFVVATLALGLLLLGAAMPASSEVSGSLERVRPPEPSLCTPAWQSVAAPDLSTSSTLFAVDARTVSDVWAVGSKANGTSFNTLVEHWNGSRWRIIRSPNPVSDENVLSGVSAIAPDDVWAVGRQGIPFAERVQPLIEHYDGRSWKIVPAPELRGETFLSAVFGVASDDVWAAGFNSTRKSARRALVLHWDGVSWSVSDVPPDPGFNNYLFALGGTGPSDVWTVGANFHNVGEPTTIHWDGHQWVRVPFSTKVWSDSLRSIAAAAPDDVWAGGTAGLYQNDKPLMVHWDGTSWSQVRFPRLGRGFSEEGDGPVNEIDGLALSSPSDVWAVGQFLSWPSPNESGPMTAFAGHWDGASWQAWPLEANVTPHQITALPGGGAWWVGERTDDDGFHAVIQRICPMVVTQSGYNPTSATVEVGETFAWKVGAGVNGTVAIQDTLGLIDSGPRVAGGSFTQLFSASGTYQLVTSAATGPVVTANVGVVPTVEPVLPSPDSRFRVRWGTSDAPSGYVFDVQIKRPGTTAFTRWHTGVLVGSAEFAADAGPGNYEFRARLRRVEGTGHTLYSPSASVLVTQRG